MLSKKSNLVRGQGWVCNEGRKSLVGEVVSEELVSVQCTEVEIELWVLLRKTKFPMENVKLMAWLLWIVLLVLWETNCR